MQKLTLLFSEYLSYKTVSHRAAHLKNFVEEKGFYSPFLSLL